MLVFEGRLLIGQAAARQLRALSTPLAGEIFVNSGQLAYTVPLEQAKTRCGARAAFRGERNEGYRHG